MKIMGPFGASAKAVTSLLKNYFSYCLLSGTLIVNLSDANAQKSSSLSARPDTTSAIEERLVALALNGPTSKKQEHQNKINEYQLKSAQNAWLNILSFSINYNDQNFAKNTNAAYVYPKYFFGITIPLGTIFSKTQVKSAREGIEMGKQDQEILKRDIREQVLTKYKQYKAYGELIAIQNEMVNDVQAELAQTEEKFRKGTVTIDAYNLAQKGHNTERAALINLKLQQDIKKLEIENMIGVKLESVLNR
jgi:outer membrane protein TolC